MRNEKNIGSPIIRVPSPIVRDSLLGYMLQFMADSSREKVQEISPTSTKCQSTPGKLAEK